MGAIALVAILHLKHHLGQLLQERPVRAGRELDDSSPGRVEHSAPAAATSDSSGPGPVDVRLALLLRRLIRLPLRPLLESEPLQPGALRVQHSEVSRDRPRLGRVVRLVVRHIDGVHEHGLQRVQHVLPQAAGRTAAARASS